MNKKAFAAHGGQRLHFAFISSNLTWGGSEDLWSEAAETLAADGHRITVYKNRLDLGEGNVARLEDKGCKLVELAKFPLLPHRFYAFMFALAHHLSLVYQIAKLYLSLRLGSRPDLAIVSQGGNFDGWLHATICLRLKLPYVLVCQKASELYWPADRFVHHVRRIYDGTRGCFFVSQSNHELTELQLGQPVPRASVVRNPFKVGWSDAPTWPDTDGSFKLACVGRLCPNEKGQDILLRVMAAEKWRQRPIVLTFFGRGEQLETLRGMAAYLNLPNVGFAGFFEDIQTLWDEHHALVLPSRAEGLPLVVVEAMLSGRIPIVTNVAGNPEVVEDNVSGFLAAAPTIGAFDEALERAWQRRDEWQSMGNAAATRIRKLVPRDPARAFATQLVEHALGGSRLSRERGTGSPARPRDA